MTLQPIEMKKGRPGTLLRVLTEADRREALADLIGPNVELHHTTLHLKPPETGMPFPLHQDSPFYQHEGFGYVDAIVHLDDTNDDNGSLRFIPGSHLRGDLQMDCETHSLGAAMRDAALEAAGGGDIDPADLRKKNFIPKSAMPYKTAVTTTYDSGDFPTIYAKAMEMAEFDSFNKRKRESARSGAKRPLDQGGRPLSADLPGIRRRIQPGGHTRDTPADEDLHRQGVEREQERRLDPLEQGVQTVAAADPRAEKGASLPLGRG